MSRHLFAGALAIAALAASGAAAQAPPGNAGAFKGAGQLPVTNETSLVIRGVPGQIVVTTKPAQEIRFTSRAKDKSGSERPLAVSIQEATVTLAPPPGVTLPDGTLRVEAPPSFSVRVDGFAGPVAITGQQTTASAQSLAGRLNADLQGGALNLKKVDGAVSARIRGGCKLLALELKGGIDLDSQDSTFQLDGVDGACRVQARGGSGELAGLSAGGDIHMSGSGLRMFNVRGELTVASDVAVEFANMASSMRFDMDGGTLHGKGNQGKVEVRARRTEISLDTIVGAVRVDGEELKLKLVGLTGEARLDVTRGTVFLQRMLGPVEAVVNQGDAQLLDLQGSARLDVQGGNAEVAWANVTAETDSLLQNGSGDITVHLPANANGRVTAKSRSGRVTSELPSIKAPPNATEVQGTLGQGQRPLIEIEAEGNVRLTSAAAAPAPPS
jgi:DUF4097 and DUF4098 domain-containing protein YvlB